MDLERYPTVAPSLFDAPQSPSEQRELFAAYVRNITLELFDYCNRQCPYCPVSLVDRRSAVKLMPEPVFERIVEDLEAIDFAGSICLNLYNEPMAHERTFEAVERFRRAVPKARVWFTTNGDYLNRKSLERLADAGLVRIVVSLHVEAGGTYDDMEQISRLSQLSARTGRPFKLDKFRPGVDFRARGRFKGIEITVKSANYLEHGVNRGGALEEIPVKAERETPCDRPFHDLTIAWNGNVYPCCQFFEGLAAHEPFVVGNIADADSLYALYCDKMMSSFRRDVFGYGPKRAPCDTCTERDKCRGAEDRAFRAAVEDNPGVVHSAARQESTAAV